MTLVLAAILLVLLAMMWVYQFAFLMSLDQERLQSADKILWAVAFILLPFLAPFAFLLWKRAMVLGPSREA